jgi:DNA-directed RNA polymerase specialized sigma24 family protein
VSLSPLAGSTGRLLSKTRRVVARSKSLTEDTTIAMQLLQVCTPEERRALLRFYCNGEDPASIAADLGITQDEFRGLRMRLQNEFLSRRNSDH